MARASPRAKIPFRGRSAPKRMTYTALARSSREEYRALIAGLRCPSGELLTDLKEQCPKCHSPHVEFKYFDNPPKRTQPRFTCNNPECKVVKFTLGGKQYNPKRGPGPDPEPSEVPGGGEEQSFTTRSSKRTRLSADTGYLHEPAGGAEEVLDSAESKSNAAHQCNYCFDDVSGTFRIECHECPDCELCIECFSINVEITRHKSSHSYQAINDSLVVPFSHAEWNSNREFWFLQKVEMFELESWGDVSVHLETRSRMQWSDHDIATQVVTTCTPLLDNFTLSVEEHQFYKVCLDYDDGLLFNQLSRALLTTDEIMELFGLTAFNEESTTLLYLDRYSLPHE